MASGYETPQQAEDAYYDAIDEADLGAMMAVWDDSPEVACLLPMQPLQIGRDAVQRQWQPLLGQAIDITVNHLQWSDQGDIALHLVEEIATASGQSQPQPPIYATNIYRRSNGRWRLLMHINSPGAPPPGVLPPIG